MHTTGRGDLTALELYAIIQVEETGTAARSSLLVSDGATTSADSIVYP
jgi:hypothetical protein